MSSIFRIADCCEVLSSKRIFASDYVDKGIPFYRSKEIIHKALNQFEGDEVYISEERFIEIKNKYGAPERGDLLISAVGNRSGICYLVKEDYYFYFKDGNLIWLRQFNDKLISNYLAYLLNSEHGQGIINNIFIGAAQKALTIDAIKKIKLDLPPLPSQRKIASILSAYDDLIENNLKRIKLLEEMAQRTYEEWFVKFRINGKPLKLNKETGLPEGWERKKLGEVVDFLSRGISPRYVEENGIPVINQKCIRNGIISMTASRLTSLETKITEDKTLHLYDVLVNSTGAGTLGRVAQVTYLSKKTIVDTHVSIIRANKKIVSPILLGFSIKAQENLITNMGKGSTNQLELSRNDLKDLVEVILPSKKTQEQFDSMIEPTLKLISKLTIQNQHLKESRDILLPRLMSGEIEV